MQPALGGQLPDLDRRDQLGAELQGLEVAAIGQVGAGQAGGEAHVVLDLRAGPRLAARAEAVQHDRAQPFRRPVDRRGQPRRPRADDHEVERLGADPPLQPEALGDPRDARPRRARPLAADDVRELVAGDVQPGQGRPAGLVLRVDPGVRHLVLVEELADRVDLRVAQRPEHPDADEPRPLEHLPADLERLDQLVAQVGQLADHPPELLGRHAIRPTCPLRVGRDHRRPIRQHRHVAREVARPVHRDRPGLVARLVDQGELAGLDHVEAVPPLPGAEQGLAVGELADPGQPRQRLDLPRAQRRGCQAGPARVIEHPPSPSVA